MFNVLCEKNYNIHDIAILQLVKGLCQKYTATLGCH